MKKCPKCKAEIQEEARFCLYCMTSFEEKQTTENSKVNNKRWLIIIAAVLAVMLISISIIVFAPKGNKPNDSNDNSSDSSVSGDLNTPADSTDTPSSEQEDEGTSDQPSSPSGNSQPQKPSKNENNPTDNTVGNTTTDNTATNNNSTSSTSSDNKTENNNSDNTSTTTTPSETTTVAYIYRDAKYGDDFSVSANPENAVVITGVKNASADGKYIIPETIDGKKVVAVMALAFCDESISNTVKTVVVPSSVKTIWNNAFANCYNLTDIYFKGNSIYTESNAFPETSKRNGTLTIHCSANCSDSNYRYYKNSASYYDAEYEEWNG